MTFIALYLYLFLALCVFLGLGWPIILAMIVNTHFHSVYIILGGVFLNVLWLYMWVKGRSK